MKIFRYSFSVTISQHLQISNNNGNNNNNNNNNTLLLLLLLLSLLMNLCSGDINVHIHSALT